MVDRNNLDLIYKQNLEESIIHHLAEVKHIEIREAMDIYYRSDLASQIEHGAYGIDNLDYRYLTEDMIENEPELFDNID